MSTSPTHSHSHPHPAAAALATSPPAHLAHLAQPHGSSAAVDDDDLLSLLGSDSFSLETARDRELLLLGSFLKGVLPPAAAGSGAHHHPAPLNAGLTISSAASAHAAGWNGWRPAPDGVAAPFGSPMSFASSSVGSSAFPAGPSTSYQSTSSLGPHRASPAQAFVPLSPPVTTSPGAPVSRTNATGASAASRGQPLNGYRAPACSRERVPTLAAIQHQQQQQQQQQMQQQMQQQAAAQEDGGWKSRLRSSARLQQQQQQQQQQQAQAPFELDEDAMME
ncbi:hypothetical protein Rhopal_001204-T1 [Rhodotorula paludigena]|uniref:Uncharacterized protein n=1 Tax=Rhodotorula paludigena TaxID=86838 RepID=A0AAV5GCP7_9BASI|nr:hypothetical protein Rhopal_001204-T1 [Rhodotorula paludigena]